MAIQGIRQAGIGGVTGAGATAKPSFSKTLKQQLSPVPKSEAAPLSVPQRGDAQPKAAPGRSHVGAPAPTAILPTALIDQVSAAQKRMDAVLELAQSGRSFSPAELLSLQSQMYRASQELDLAGKVIEKATGGVKQILQTQV